MIGALCSLIKRAACAEGPVHCMVCRLKLCGACFMFCGSKSGVRKRFYGLLCDDLQMTGK